MANTRAILIGACWAVALCWGALSGPPPVALALLVVPLPMLVLGGISGVTQAAAAALVAGAVMGLLLDWTVGVGFLALAGVPAVVAVALLRGAWRLEAVIVAAVGASLAGALGLVLLHNVEPATWAAMVTKTVRQGVETATEAYREVGASALANADFDAARDANVRWIVTRLPAFLIALLSALWLVNLGLSRRWAGWPQLTSLGRWRNADWMIWVLIASGFAMFVPVEVVSRFAVNVFWLTLACYLAQGMAIVSFFLVRLGLPRGLRVATYLIIILQQVAAGLVVALGVFDLWGDFRHLTARPADAAIGRDSKS